MRKQKMFIRFIAGSLVVVFILGLLVMGLAGCSSQDTPDVSVSTPPVATKNEGDVFLSSGFKIRSVVTPQATATLDPVIFEVYVDSNGNGSGLAGYKDDVYDVLISSDKLYLQLGANSIVNVSDITGHLVPASLSLSSVSSLSSLGFLVIDGKVSSYKGNVDNLLFDGAYQSSDSSFDSITVADSNSMSLADLITTVFNQAATTVTPGNDEQQTTDRVSYYGNSNVGVTIHDVTYSISDFCDPNTYFESQIPSGLVPEYGWNKDVQVELLHITYTSSDGKTEFMTTDGYVQAISTSSPFKWLELEQGMSVDEVQKKLGIGLKKDELASFTPMLDGMTASKGRNNGFVVNYGQLSVLLQCESKTKDLRSITISNYIDFMEVG